MQCEVCGCWDGDGDDPVNLVEMFPVTVVWVDNTERTAGEQDSHMALCEDCARLDPIRDEVDVFGNEERVYLA